MLAWLGQLWSPHDTSIILCVFLGAECGFLLLVIAEYLSSRFLRRDDFNKDELRVSAMTHFSQWGISRLNKGWRGFLYIYAYNFRVLELNPNSWWTYIFAFAVVDLAYYWNHRYLHTFGLGWAHHIVHHMPTRFNLSVAFRIGLFETVALGWIIWFIIPLMGVPPLLMAVGFAVHNMFTFLTHTAFVPKLPVIEWLFVTPHHHRIHHASNEEYIDHNFGGALIIWDRLFGTFKELHPGIPIVYGIKNPPPERFFDVILFGWKNLFKKMIKERSIRPLYVMTNYRSKTSDRHLEPSHKSTTFLASHPHEEMKSHRHSDLIA